MQVPGLTFVTLPGIFSQMPGGTVWSALFFLLLMVAGITSSISLLEVVGAYFMDELKWSRKKTAWLIGTIIFFLGIPSAYSLTGGLKVGGKDFLDAADFLASNILLPLGGIFISLFVGWFWKDEADKEITNQGTQPFGLHMPWIWICRIVAPLALVYIFITGLKW